QDAEREVRQGLSAWPQDLALLLTLVRSLLLQERADEALEASRLALATAPDHPYALLLCSAAQSATGDRRSALATIEAALHVAPDAPILHFQLGSLLHEDDRPAEALASFATARSLDPQDADIPVGIAGALLDLRRNEEASAAIADALTLDPNHAGAHRLRGMLALRTGTSQDALDSTREAVRLNPTNAGVREDLTVAMKARNPVYRALWRYSDWLAGQSDLVRTGFLFIPFILYRVLRAVGGEAAWVNVAAVLMISVLAVSWLTEPLMNVLILASRFGRGLLPIGTKRATMAFLAVMLVAITCAVAGLVTDLDDLLLLALGSLAWSATVGGIPQVPAHRQRVVAIIAGVAGALIVTTMGLALAGAAASGPLSLVVLFGGLASLWGIAALTR
ncbi:MAG TPA: tetratricopeptide repeat protein, partial [Tetrasphaera sp.]|nr:tetratricopeptide repeat protein [Tetrasphaera sp.]